MSVDVSVDVCLIWFLFAIREWGVFGILCKAAIGGASSRWLVRPNSGQMLQPGRGYQGNPPIFSSGQK